MEVPFQMRQFKNLMMFRFFLTAFFLLQFSHHASGQVEAKLDSSCENYISIHGSSNVNQFQLINHNPKIVNFSGDIGDKKHYQRIEIPVTQFKGDNNRMRQDFLELIKASEYPNIIVKIESRALSECSNYSGSSDFKTEITIAGVSKSYVVPCSIDSCKNSDYVLKGSLEVKLTDFELDPPTKFFGLIKVNNEVEINYIFRFRPEDDIFRSSMNQKVIFQGVSFTHAAKGFAVAEKSPDIGVI